MHRVTCPSTVASGNSARIITHATERSSRVEVGGRVFINARDRVKPAAATGAGAATLGSLAQRNNDCMRFSWDPIQVVNLSRQQKAHCTRELTRLSHLQRHFNRQSHIENYQQNNQIDKYRQRLARLSRLRMLEGDLSNSAPLQTSAGSYREVGSFPRAGSYARRRQSPEKPSDFYDPAQKILTDKCQSRSNKGYNKPSVKYTNGGYYLAPGVEVNFPRVYLEKDIINPVGQANVIRSEISSRKRVGFIPAQCYQKADIKSPRGGPAGESTGCDSENKLSDFSGSTERSPKRLDLSINNTDVPSEGQLPKVYGSYKKKSVKFSENLDTIFELSEICDTPRKKRPEIKTFMRMASIAKNFESGK